MLRIVTIAASLALLLSACSASNTTTEPRKEISYLRGPYNAAFFRRHLESNAYSAGFHFHHGKEHDVTLLTPPADRARMDDEFDRQMSCAILLLRPVGLPTWLHATHRTGTR